MQIKKANLQDSVLKSWNTYRVNLIILFQHYFVWQTKELLLKSSRNGHVRNCSTFVTAVGAKSSRFPIPNVRDSDTLKVGYLVRNLLSDVPSPSIGEGLRERGPFLGISRNLGEAVRPR